MVGVINMVNSLSHIYCLLTQIILRILSVPQSMVLDGVNRLPSDWRIRN